MSRYPRRRWDQPKPKTNSNMYNGNWFPPIHVPPPMLDRPPPLLDRPPPLLDRPPPSLCDVQPIPPWEQGPHNQFLWPPTDFHSDDYLPSSDFEIGSSAGFYQSGTMNQGNINNERNPRMEEKDGIHDHSRSRDQDRDHGHVHDYDRDWAPHPRRNQSGRGGGRMEPQRGGRRMEPQRGGGRMEPQRGGGRMEPQRGRGSESQHKWHAKKENLRYKKDTGPDIQNPGFTNGHRKDAKPNEPPNSSGRHIRWNWDQDNMEDNDESNEINTWLLSSKDNDVHRKEITKDNNKSPLPGSEEARNNAIREATDRLKQALSKKKSTSVNIVNLLSGTSKTETSVSKTNPYLLEACKNLAQLELDASDMRAIGRANTGSVNCPLDEGDTNEEAAGSEAHVVDISGSPSSRNRTHEVAITSEVAIIDSSPSTSSSTIAEDKEIQRKDTNKRIANAKKSNNENDVMERQAVSISSSPQSSERPLQGLSTGDSCGSVSSMSIKTTISPSQADVSPHSSAQALLSIPNMSCDVRNLVNTPSTLTDSNAFSPSSALVKKLLSKNRLQDLINSRSCKKVEFAMRELVKQHRTTLSKEVRRVAESRIPSTPCGLLELPPDDSTLLADLTIDWQNLPSELISSLGDLFQNFADVEDDPALMTTASTSHNVEGIAKLSGRNISSSTVIMEQETMLAWETKGVGYDQAMDLLKNLNSVPLEEEMNSKVSSSDETTSVSAEKSVQRGMIQLSPDSSPIGDNIEVGQQDKQSGTCPLISQNACEQMQNQNINGFIISSDGREGLKPIQFTEQAINMSPAPRNHQIGENFTPPPLPFVPISGCSVQDEILSPILGIRKGNIRVRPFAREICMEDQQKTSTAATYEICMEEQRKTSTPSATREICMEEQQKTSTPSARSEQAHQKENRDDFSIHEMPLEFSNASDRHNSNCDSSVLSSKKLIQQAVKKKRLEMAEQEKVSLKTLSAHSKKNKKCKRKKQKRKLLLQLGERIWFQDKSNKKQKKKSTLSSENATDRRLETLPVQESSPTQTLRKKKKPSKSANKSLEKECVSVVGQSEPCSFQKSPTHSSQSLGERLHSYESEQKCEINCESLDRVSSTCETLNQPTEEIPAIREENFSVSRFCQNQIEHELAACVEDEQSPAELPSLSVNSTEGAASESLEGVSILQLLKMTVPAATAQTCCDMDESDIIRRLLEIDSKLQTLVQEKLDLTHALKQKQLQKQGQQRKQGRSLEERECFQRRSPESLRPSDATISNAPVASRLAITEVVHVESEDEVFVLPGKDLGTKNTAQKAATVMSDSCANLRKKRKRNTLKNTIECGNNPTPQEEQSMNSSNKSGTKRKATEMQDCFVCVESLPQSTIETLMARPKNVAQSVSDVIKVPDAQNTIHNGSILDIQIHKKKLIAGAEDGNVYVYSLKTGKLRKTFMSSNSSNPITCMIVVNTEDASLVFTGSNDGKLQCFNMETGENAFHPLQVSNSIQCMEQNWNQLFIGTKTGFIVPFHIKKKNIKEPLTSGGSCVLSIQSTTEGPRRVLVVASRRQPITIRDAVSGLYLRTLNSNFSATVYSLLLHSSLVYCGTITQNISVFDFQSGALAFELKAGNGVVCLKMLKGLLFAACYDNKLYIFDIKTKQLVTSLSFPGTMILSLAVTDSKMIVACKGALMEVNYPDEVRALLLRDEDEGDGFQCF